MFCDENYKKLLFAKASNNQLGLDDLGAISTYDASLPFPFGGSFDDYNPPASYVRHCFDWLPAVPHNALAGVRRR